MTDSATAWNMRTVICVTSLKSHRAVDKSRGVTWYIYLIATVGVPPAVFIISHHYPAAISVDKRTQSYIKGKKTHGWFASLINRATNGCCSFRTAVCLNKQRKGREKCSMVLFTGRAGKSTINWHSSLCHRRLSITVWPDSTPLRGLSAEDCRQEESKGGKKTPTIVPLLSWKADA